jgi:hypothetical protein
MSAPQNKGYYIELNESVLLAARTASLGHPAVIEDLREVTLDNKATVAQALTALFPEAGNGTARIVCALRPRQRFSHLAGDDEAAQSFTQAALQAFVGSFPPAGSGPNEIIVLQADTGLQLDGKPGSRWFLTGAPQASVAAMQSTLREWKLEASRSEAAAVAMLGAVFAEQRRTGAAPVLIWDIGDTGSELFLVGNQALQAVNRLAFGFDKIAESVQTELNLKFKGAASKLFFNEFYDFSEVGPKIADKVAGSLKAAVAEISAKYGAPAALLCTGLTSKQSWFTDNLAKSVELSPWQPDMAAWCDSVGLTFVHNALQAKLSPGWLGLLSVVSASQANETVADSSWHLVWGGNAFATEEKPAAVKAASAAPMPTPPPAVIRPATVPPIPKTIPPTAPVRPPQPAPRTIPPTPVAKAPVAPTPAVRTIPPTAPIAATARFQPQAAPRMIPPTAPAKAPGAPTPAVRTIPPTAASMAQPRPAVVIPPRTPITQKAAVFQAATPAPKPAPFQPKPAPAPAKPVPSPAPSASATPSGSPKPSLAAKPPTGAEPSAGAKPFIKTPAGMAVIGILAVLLIGGFFFYRQVSQDKAEALRKQTMAEQQAKTDREARQQADQRAAAEKEAARKAQEESARTIAAEAAARQQAAEENRRHEAETNRLLNGRGSLTIVTEPAGATIAISNLAPRVSPATVNDLRLGHYTVGVTLTGYEPVNLEVEIKDNEATDPGPVRLIRQTGSLEIVTEPAGINFEVRPAAARFFAAGADVKQGKTPATLADLPTGDYAVIFSREGWPNRTENVVVESKSTAHITAKFTGGTVEITSAPTGANVIRNGTVIGTTPLTLQDQQPGDVEYSLELQGFIGATVTGRIEAEKLLRLSTNFRSQDRIARERA